jgi:hypothetical protein
MLPLTPLPGHPTCAQARPVHKDWAPLLNARCQILIPGLCRTPIEAAQLLPKVPCPLSHAIPTQIGTHEISPFGKAEVLGEAAPQQLGLGLQICSLFPGGWEQSLGLIPSLPSKENRHHPLFLNGGRKNSGGQTGQRSLPSTLPSSIPSATPTTPC